MELVILLAVLACPIVMGTMMLLMWRGMRAHGKQEGVEEAAPEQPLAEDRGEVARR